MSEQMSAQYRQVVQDLEQGRTVLIDGGTGTEIERRGIKTVTEAWSSSGALDGPEIVQEVHEDYLRTGARIVISNTFATSLHALVDAGMEEHFENLNRDGVNLVHQAIERSGIGAVVAGGITDWSWTRRHPPLDVLRLGVEAQAKIMADAGAELLLLEMMADVERMLTVLDAAQQSGLPVWVGFSCTTGFLEGEPGYQLGPGEPVPPHPAPGQVRLLNGPTLAEGLQALAGKDVPVVSIMHSQVEDIDAALDVTDQHWSGPVGVYAHSGHFVKPNWIFNDVISPADYRTAAAGWVDRGVQVIGGCCGIGPAHMELLAGELDGR
ncbi:MAG: homocysteine S-methyltransferase family protein [Actinomycetota bacterium]